MEYTIDEVSKGGEVLNRYIRGRLLGKGGFAKCYEATHVDTKEKLAVKVISKASLEKPKTRQKLKTEIKIHRSITHRHIVRFHKYFEDNRNVYIMMELCKGQTLMEQSNRKGRFSEEETAYLLHQCLLSLKHMHAQGIIHRDLKLGNIMLSADNEVKVGDFGLAAKVDHIGEKRRTLCGTPNYIAPEILQNGHIHSFEVDVWTVGIIMYAMLCGKPPFQTSDVKTTYGRIKRCSYSFPPHVALSREAKGMIARILQVNPDARPSVQELLEDPWFSMHKARTYAPLSLFTPGTASYHAQQLRLVEERKHNPAAEASLPAGRDKARREPLGRIDSNVAGRAAGNEKIVYEGGRVPRTRSMAIRGEENNVPAVGSPQHRGVRSNSAALKPQSVYTRHGGGGGGGGAKSPSAYLRRMPTRSSSAAGSGSPLRLYNSSPAVPSESPQAMRSASRSGSPSAAGIERLQNVRRSPSAGSSRGRVSSPSSSSRQPHVLRPQRGSSSSTASRPRFLARSSSPSPSVPSSTIVRRSSSPSETAVSAPASTPAPQAPAAPAPQAAPTVSSPSPAPAPSATPDVVRQTANDDDDQNLTRLHTKLEETLALNGQGEAEGTAPQLLGPQLWVTECTDFTKEYGLAYRLSNGQIAVHFNDNTKMVHSVDTGVIWYVDRIKTRDRTRAAKESISQHHISSYPDSLSKKVTLITYFGNYIVRFKGRPARQGQQDVVTCSTADTTASSGVANPGSDGLVYVRKWLKTPEATIFRLSNKTVQVSFADQTEVILSAEAKLVTYTERNGERSTFSLSSMSYTQPEVAHRLRHTKDIIGQLINVNRR